MAQPVKEPATKPDATRTHGVDGEKIVSLTPHVRCGMYHLPTQYTPVPSHKNFYKSKLNFSHVLVKERREERGEGKVKVAYFGTIWKNVLRGTEQLFSRLYPG